MTIEMHLQKIRVWARPFPRLKSVIPHGFTFMSLELGKSRSKAPFGEVSGGHETLL